MTDSLTPYLILDPEDEKGICFDFLTEAVARFDEDETVKPMLTRAVAGLSYQLSNITMNDDYKPYVQVFSL
jgi:ubiquitin conjugation factor E4 B